jgi:hypothetical protein
MRIPGSLLALALLVTRPARPQATPAPISASTVLPAAGLQADAAILRRAYEQLHPGLYRYNSRAQMDAAFDQLTADLGLDQTLQQAFLRIARFTSQIRCGHTYPNFFNQSNAVASAVFERPDKLPFLFRWIDRSMIVTRDLTPEHSLPAGTEVQSINGVPARQILATLLPLTRGDGANDAKRIDLLQLQNRAIYQEMDVFLPMLYPEWRSPFRLTVRRPGGGAATQITAAARTFTDRKSDVASGHASSSPDAPLFTLSNLPGGGALLTMPTWSMYNSKWDWKTWLNDALDRISARKAPALVIDLRGNEGGDDVGALILARLGESAQAEDEARLVRYRKVPADLLPFLQTWDPSFKDWGSQATEMAAPWPTAPPVPYLRQSPEAGGQTVPKKGTEPAPQRQAAAPAATFHGRVFVLIDAANSSATFRFARVMQQRHLGLLAGEPTGGNQRGINGGAFFFLNLPHSGIEVDLPLIGYFPATPQPDAGVVPDLSIPLSAEDIAQGRDPVLAKINGLLSH